MYGLPLKSPLQTEGLFFVCDEKKCESLSRRGFLPLFSKLLLGWSSFELS